MGRLLTLLVNKKQPFDPFDDASLIVQLDSRYKVYSDAGVTPVVDGEPVQEFGNIKEGQAISEFSKTGERRPIYRTAGGVNGIPYLEFDGTHYLESNGYFNEKEATIFVVCEPEGDMPGGTVALLGKRYNNFNMGWNNSYAQFSNSYQDNTAGVFGASKRSRKVLLPETAVTIGGRYGGGGKWQMFENYALLGESTNSKAAIGQSNEKLRIGAWRYAANNGQAFLTGKIYAIHIYNRRLNNAEYDSVVTAFAERYNHHITENWYKNLHAGAQRGALRQGYTQLSDFPTRDAVAILGQSNAQATNSQNPAIATSPVISNLDIINSNYSGEFAGTRRRSGSDAVDLLNIGVNNGGNSLDPSDPAFGIESSMMWNLNNGVPNGYDIVKVAAGGTKLASEWAVADGYLYARAIEYMKELIFSGGEADGTIYDKIIVPWLHGEGDALSGSASSAYLENEDEFITAMRSEFVGYDFRFIAATVYGQTYAPAVNAAKAANAAEYDFYTLVEGAGSGDTHDGVHYTAQFTVDLGEEIAAVILAF